MRSEFEPCSSPDRSTRSTDSRSAAWPTAGCCSSGWTAARICSAADDPHGQPPRGLTASVLKLGWLWLNWWLAWFQTLRHGCRRGYLIFDRYHGDLLVDPNRYRYGGPDWLAVLASRWMPQPDRAKKLSLRFKKTHNNFSPSPGTQGSKSLIAISYLDSQPLLS